MLQFMFSFKLSNLLDWMPHQSASGCIYTCIWTNTLHELLPRWTRNKGDTLTPFITAIIINTTYQSLINITGKSQTKCNAWINWKGNQISAVYSNTKNCCKIHLSLNVLVYHLSQCITITMFQSSFTRSTDNVKWQV